MLRMSKIKEVKKYEKFSKEDKKFSQNLTKSWAVKKEREQEEEEEDEEYLRQRNLSLFHFSLFGEVKAGGKRTCPDQFDKKLDKKLSRVKIRERAAGAGGGRMSKTEEVFSFTLVLLRWSNNKLWPTKQT